MALGGAIADSQYDNLWLVAWSANLGFFVAGFLVAAGTGSRSLPNLSTQRMVAAVDTPVCPAGFMVAISYYYSNCQEGLAVQLSNAVAHANYHRLVSSRVTGSQIHRIQSGATLFLCSLDRAELYGSGVNHSCVHPCTTALLEDRPAGHIESPDPDSGGLLY